MPPCIRTLSIVLSKLSMVSTIKWLGFNISLLAKCMNGKFSSMGNLL